MRIAICGAGISGLTLAGILSRQLARTLPSARIEVFERAPADRDQGYGLDLDEHGQVALVRAGVSREDYWRLSRPYSDSAAIYFGSDADPGFVMFRPTLLQQWFPSAFGARPESNRASLRQVLLKAMAPHSNVQVHFDQGVFGIKHAKNGTSADLLDREGTELGTFDLVIDGMGVHSTIRQHRVLDKAGGKHSNGIVMLHGVIDDPETTWKPDLMARFQRHGSMMGVARGFNILAQRFGPGNGDNRTSFFYLVAREDGEGGVFRDVGVEPTQSRASGIMSDDRLQKVKDWILSDMNGVFAPFWEEVVTSVDRITIREQMVHGETELLSEREYPLICIGDSLWNCGLGGGGILAMQDSLELANLILDPESRLFDPETGAMDLANPALKKIEGGMLERKAEFNQRSSGARARMLERTPGKAGTKMEWIDVIPGDSYSALAMRFVASWTLPLVSRVFVSWYNQELQQGVAGSDRSSPLFPVVTQALEEEETLRSKF